MISAYERKALLSSYYFSWMGDATFITFVILGGFYPEGQGVYWVIPWYLGNKAPCQNVSQLLRAFALAYKSLT